DRDVDLGAAPHLVARTWVGKEAPEAGGADVAEDRTLGPSEKRSDPPPLLAVAPMPHRGDTPKDTGPAASPGAGGPTPWRVVPAPMSCSSEMTPCWRAAMRAMRASGSVAALLSRTSVTKSPRPGFLPRAAGLRPSPRDLARVRAARRPTIGRRRRFRT